MQEDLPALRSVLHGDVDSTIAVVERQLEFVRGRSYDKKYADLKARQYIPVDTTVPAGAETVKFNIWDGHGIAKVVKSYASDLPRVDISVQEVRQGIHTVADSFGYSNQELRAAAFAGVNLDMKKALMARRAWEEYIDKAAGTGDLVYNLPGLATVPNATVFTVPNGASGHQAWSTKTPQEVLNDVFGLIGTMETTTLGIERPNTLLLSLAAMRYLRTTLLGTTINNTTILDFINRAYPGIVVDSWVPACTGTGTAGTDRAILFRSDEEALVMVIPMEFQQNAAQPRNLEVIVPCEGRYGGVQVFYPLSVAFMDGI